MTKRTNRRSFLGKTAAAGAVGVGYWAGTSPILKAQESALQGLSAACVGVGGKGGSDTRHISEHGVNIAALCDIDGGTVTKMAREFPKAEQFSDFREMLDKMGDKVDIVTVSTPDHNHAAAAVRAMRMKKHMSIARNRLTWSISRSSADARNRRRNRRRDSNGQSGNQRRRIADRRRSRFKAVRSATSAKSMSGPTDRFGRKARDAPKAKTRFLKT